MSLSVDRDTRLGYNLLMFTNRDHKFFDLAYAAANTSLHPKAKIGAVIVKRNDVISVGVNKYGKSHPLQKHYNTNRRFFSTEIAKSHNIHAELDALIKVKKRDIKGSTIYVSRVPYDSERHLGMCRPCPACMEALRDFEIERIFYTTDEGLAFELIV